MRDTTKDHYPPGWQPPLAEPSLANERSVAAWEAFGIRCAAKRKHTTPATPDPAPDKSLDVSRRADSDVDV